MSLAADDPRHGTYTGYVNHGCRCGGCSAAAREYMRQRYTIPCYRCNRPIYTHGTKNKLALDERGGLCGPCYAETTRIDVHGTEYLYTRGCKCSDCRAAAAAARRRRRHTPGSVQTHNAAGYRNGCRCEVCLSAHRERLREYKRRRRAA